MSEATHTPGPWRLDDGKHSTVLASDYHAIDAGCGFHQHASDGFGITGVMSFADARLIASAPELLEALRECEEFFDQRADADQPAGCDSPIPNEEMKMLTLVRAALAKASPSTKPGDPCHADVLLEIANSGEQS